MTNRSNLTEGMREGDLANMLLPIISVDEYESKIDDSAVVIGFYINDLNAARDLNRYIQKSPQDIIDTEISPAPDQHGYYLVFVEIINNKQLPKIIMEIIADISPLVSVDTWEMRLRGEDSPKVASESTLMQYFGYSIEENVYKILTNTELHEATVTGSCLRIATEKYAAAFEVIDIAPISIMENHKLLREESLSITRDDVNTSKIIMGMLGEGWFADKFGDYWLLHQGGNSQGILAREKYEG